MEVNLNAAVVRSTFITSGNGCVNKRIRSNLNFTILSVYCKIRSPCFAEATKRKNSKQLFHSPPYNYYGWLVLNLSF